MAAYINQELRTNGEEDIGLVFPALLNGLTNTFGVLSAVILVEIRGFDIGRG